MGALEKAKLQEVSADEHETTIGSPVPVQFNPSSLKLKLTNQMEGGRSTGRVRRQRSGAGNTVLTMELVFDTADEGDDANPVSVRTKTAIVERYVVPNSDSSQTPPRLRFEWNDLVVSGLVESVNIDFDLFASNGTPLRAKVNLSIKEQEPKYQLKTSDSATQPGQSNANNNSNNNNNNGNGGGSGNSTQSAPALDGETPAEFAARNGLDPNAWRGLDVDLSAGLNFSAGLEVGFSAGLSVSAGIGISAGVKAGVDVSLEAALGLSVEAKASASAKVNIGGVSVSSAGVALSSAGGVAAAIETVKVANSTAAAEQAKLSFGQTATTTTSASTSTSSSASTLVSSINAGSNTVAAQTVAASSRQVHTPLSSSGPRSVTDQQKAQPAPAPPLADPRAISFGAGVPLRPVIKSASEQARPRVKSGKTKRGLDGPPLSSDPSTPAWEALPRRGTVRPSSRFSATRNGNNACGCKGGKA